VHEEDGFEPCQLVSKAPLRTLTERFQRCFIESREYPLAYQWLMKFRVSDNGDGSVLLKINVEIEFISQQTTSLESHTQLKEV
jgi:hypothetical protein